MASNRGVGSALLTRGEIVASPMRSREELRPGSDINGDDYGEEEHR